jgi:ribonucleoside-diphosphate reductase beta chain
MTNVPADFLRRIDVAQYGMTYSRASTRGNWGEVWDSFDKRKKKVANDGAAEAASDEADMFAQVGVETE